jgi:LmbE family N-acetylglucosaminyl deacetylase
VNPFRKFVSEHARLFQSGKKLPRSRPQKFQQHRKVPGNAPKALIFSPHPDDECIVGGLALRLLREAKWNVINVAVTFGGKKERRKGRLCELQNACGLLGFDLIPLGLDKINPTTRKKNRGHWMAAVAQIKDVLKVNKPRVIFFPHERDGHGTHIGAHFLVLDALKKMPRSFECFVVETEFWGQMTDSNLLVESGVEDVSDLVAALACHVGEVRRNPYHALLPAWMLDNVRRAELVGGPSFRRSGSIREGGQGGVAPDFTFATIYRLRKWSRGRLVNAPRSGKFLSRTENTAKLFR